MKLIFTTPTTSDRKYYDDLFEAKGMLDNRVKIIATDDNGNTTELFSPQEEVERLGHEYIRAHAVMTYNKSIDSWVLSYSQNDYYNDTERNPEKVIKVKYCGDEGGTGREVYKGIETGRYYLRESYYPREKCAKWYVCGKRRIPEDGDEPRANLIFECNGEREKVRYDDWNGVAAYQDTFNVNFKPSEENYPYLSQTRDFDKLKERYSEETLTEFEAAIYEYEEAENPEDYEEAGLDPIISWYEGLLDTSDLFNCYAPDYSI